MLTTAQPQDPARQPWLLPRSFTVRLDMLSDWHVGSGTGRPGSVDRLIARDPDDLPYIPAKTLTGIWRDALERLATALDDGEEEGQWAAWTDMLFGSQPALARGAHTEAPRPAALEISPARLPDVLRTRLVGQERTVLRQALTFVKPGVAIDPQRGQARPDHLRFEEMARTGTILSATCTLDLPEHSDQQAAASALLLASAQLVEHLGGKRRRGAGCCRLTIVDRQPLEAVQWLQSHAQSPALPAVALRQLSGSVVPATSAIQPSTTGAWLALPMSLQVQTPLAVAARTLGNVTETLDYVPGTLLLPHVTRILLALGYADCQAAVAAGMLQILPATLDIHGTRGRPVPHVLFQRKMGGGFEHQGTIVNRLLEASSHQVQLKGLRIGYIGAWGDRQLPPYDRVPQVLLTHNTVEDTVQRPTSDVGGVYSRQAIAAGVRLRTELRLHPAVAEALQAHHAWWVQLQDACRLGVSRKDDYGLVTLTVQGPPQPPVLTACFDPEQTNRLTVWLLSDVLLRDNALRPGVASDCLRDALAARLEVKLKAAEPAERCLRELLQVHRIESWHTRWGQPRPSLVAIAAGSCALFDIDEPLDQTQRSAVEARLREMEATGIGERRGEGYGQLCFNAALLTSPLGGWAAAGQPAQRAPRQQTLDTSVSAPLTVTDNADAHAYAQHLELVAWREALQRVVLGIADNEQRRQEILHIRLVRQRNSPPQSQPPLSQLGGLRTVLQDLQSAADRPRVVRWLEHVQDTPNRRDKWPDGALSALTDLLQDETAVWKMLAPDWQSPPVLTAPRDLRATEGRVGELQTILWAEAVRALVDACLRAHKRDTEQSTPAQETTHGA